MDTITQFYALLLFAVTGMAITLYYFRQDIRKGFHSIKKEEYALPSLSYERSEYAPQGETIKSIKVSCIAQSDKQAHLHMAWLLNIAKEVEIKPEVKQDETKNKSRRTEKVY